MALALSKILKTFNKTLTQLETLIQQNDAAVAENTAQIDRIQQTNLDLIAEKQQASNVRDNLTKLLEG